MRKENEPVNILQMESLTREVIKKKHWREIEICTGILNTFLSGFSSMGSFELKEENESEYVWLLILIRGLDSIKCAIDLMLKGYITDNRLTCDGGSGLVFVLNRHRAWQIVRDCAKRVGLAGLVNPETGRMRGVSPHRLRDAFAVNAMKLDDSGDALRLLQEHLGHASFDTTARYRKIAGEEHRKWYERLWSETS